jgi:hypothetical protein
MIGTHTDPNNRAKTALLKFKHRRRGVSLLQILCVTAMFAVLSAILFPRFATPTQMATVGVVETASSLAAQNMWQEESSHVVAAMRHGPFFRQQHLLRQAGTIAAPSASNRPV